MTACGKKSSDSSDLSEGKSSEPLPLSKALTTKKGIWFSSDTPGKDTDIYYALVSDGKGTIKYYSTLASGLNNPKEDGIPLDVDQDNLRYKDLKGLGLNEIENILKKKSDSIRSLSPRYVMSGSVCSGVPLEISFSAKTDPSGNSTVLESLRNENIRKDGCSIGYSDEFSVPSPELIQVYDKNFSGLLVARHPDADDENQSTYRDDGRGLYAMIAPDSPGFTLDPPGTEGVKFDEDEDQQR
ncbi:MAG: hypothetical protein R5N72_06435 [Cutibacterium granulosum]|uniref:hypothetical protein n=1 Tax=Cutibacterium granulosum TaxID=33011 RepID=UPI002B231043|nr:hypothetical protein [Cutibacterium granulosum]MEA5660019.1 hypothetical protein [Cutibacterium granulosum]MEA5661681.1 hypothetical protein [Cutibacterium granulosum]